MALAWENPRRTRPLALYFLLLLLVLFLFGGGGGALILTAWSKRNWWRNISADPFSKKGRRTGRVVGA